LEDGESTMARLEEKQYSDGGRLRLQLLGNMGQKRNILERGERAKLRGGVGSETRSENSSRGEKEKGKRLGIKLRKAKAVYPRQWPSMRKGRPKRQG